MPYASTSELPDAVRDHVPEHAQEIYKEAFNSAWNEYADRDERRGDESREEAAHKVAWAAVKKKYRNHPLMGAGLAMMAIDTLRQNGKRLGKMSAELGWILEDNHPVRLQLQAHKYIWGANVRGV